jgi:hypothetical protein
VYRDISYYLDTVWVEAKNSATALPIMRNLFNAFGEASSYGYQNQFTTGDPEAVPDLNALLGGKVSGS